METKVILSVLAGLVLFLYAVQSLSDTAKQLFGEKVQIFLQKYASNTFKSVAIGLVLTAILDSSSAVIILTIVLVNSQSMTFRQAMGVVLGANIGTTISSQIIVLNLGLYSPIFLVAGFIMLLFAKTARLGNNGKLLLYFGILFFGLQTMENAVEPLKHNDWFVWLLSSANLPLNGALIGAMATLLMQSSSAVVGMAIILVKKEMLTTIGGIAIMLGAELGTCADTLLATINSSKAAIKTGVFHLGFNVISIFLGLLFFDHFQKLIHYICFECNPEQILANAHVAFNIGGVLLLIWFIPYFERLLNHIWPD